MKIFLIRHGKPDIHRGRWIGRKDFARYIDAYEQAGLDPQSRPPEPIVALGRALTHVFTSDRPRAVQSGRAIAPQAQLISDPLFMEAQLKSPPVPALRLHAAGWSVLARLAWHAGDARGIETWMQCKRRAVEATETLAKRAETDGAVMLVAHGYINLMIGIRLVQRGWTRQGKHMAEFWNCVVYEKPSAG